MKAGDFVDNGIWLAQGTVEGWTAKEYNRGCKGCSRSQKLGGGLGEDAQVTCKVLVQQL